MSLNDLAQKMSYRVRNFITKPVLSDGMLFLLHVVHCLPSYVVHLYSDLLPVSGPEDCIRSLYSL